MFFDSCNGYWYAEKPTMPSSISSSMAFFYYATEMEKHDD